MRYISLATMIAASLTGTANAQAFGVHEGDSISKYQGRSTGQDIQYTIQVPEPNSEFDQYVAYWTPKTGICAVSGLGKTHSNDGYGVEIRTSFSNLHTALAAKYGTSQDFDFLESGALFDKPSEFSWSLYEKERNLASFWGVQQGSQNLGNVSGIMLLANAVSPTGTYLSLRYEFNNYAVCKSASSERDNAGL